MLRALVLTLGLTLAAPALAAPGAGPDGTGGQPGSARPPIGTSEDAPRTSADARAVNVAVTVVHARDAAGGVAPELDKISKYLIKSFPKHRSFTRLSTHAKALAIGAEARLALPNGIELVYKHTGWKDGYAAIQLDVGGLSSTVNVKDGGTFFQAGRAYDGGMIVLAIEVSALP